VNVIITVIDKQHTIKLWYQNRGLIIHDAAISHFPTSPISQEMMPKQTRQLSCFRRVEF